MQSSFFDLTQPVGLVETWVSIFVVLLLMWIGFLIVKRTKTNATKDKDK